MYIDFSGKKLQITDKSTAKKQDVELFIAILPHRQYPDVQACRSQQRSDLICCCLGALAFYGGVPQMMVLDNLKAAVDRVHQTGLQSPSRIQRFCQSLSDSGLLD